MYKRRIAIGCGILLVQLEVKQLSRHHMIAKQRPSDPKGQLLATISSVLQCQTGHIEHKSDPGVISKGNA